MGRSGKANKKSAKTIPTRQILLGSGSAFQNQIDDQPASRAAGFEAELSRASVDDLPRLWRQITKSPVWRKIPISDDIRDNWISNFIYRKDRGLPPLFPGTYITLPSGHQDQGEAILGALIDLKSSDPDAFNHFFLEEILPGIKGKAPPLLRSSRHCGRLLVDALNEKFPECSSAISAIEDNKIFDTAEVPYYLFAWNTLAAIEAGADPVEAAGRGARMTIQSKLEDRSVLRRAQIKLYESSERFRGMAGLSPDECNEAELWGYLKDVFSDTNEDAWLALARGETSLENIFCDFLGPF